MTRLEFVDDFITTPEIGGAAVSVCVILLDTPTEIVVASLSEMDITATRKILV